MSPSPLNLRTLNFLTGSHGQSTLERLAGEDLSDANTLPLLDSLRRELPPEQACAALTLARLRVRAASKFSRSHAMFFTPDALEQATAEPVSRWRARRFGDYHLLADLGCGIGGDTLALAALPGATVIGIDRDLLRLRMAGANSAAYGQAARFVQGDLCDPLPLAGVEAAFFDPGRRAGSRRLFSVRDYIPPLDVIAGWSFAALAVKLSPGIDLAELGAYTAQGAGIEFVSMGGALKEAVLWCGEAGFAGRCASRVKPSGAGETLRPQGAPPPPLSAPRAYLVEPDPAIIRAGLLGELTEHLGVALYRLDDSIAYLTGDALVHTPWARFWSIRDWMPFNLKRLRAALRARGIRHVTVKKRGSPLTPEGLIRKLKLAHGDGEAVIVLTQVNGQHTALICDTLVTV